jgi:hydroxylysine kinase
MTFADPFAVLTTAAPALTVDAAAAALRDHYSLTGTFEPLASERDQNFLVTTPGDEKYVLKFANSAELAGVTDFQTAAMLHIAERRPGFPIPRVVRTLEGDTTATVEDGDGRRHRVRLLTWLEGLPLQHTERTPGYAATLGSCLAELGRALRDFKHSASGYALLWDLKGAAALGELLDCVDDRELRALCAGRLDAFESRVVPRFDDVPWQVIHNDLNPSNVLVSPNDARKVKGVIDFGDLVRSPRVVDVAVASSYLLRDQDDSLADVLDFVTAYCKVEPLEATEIEILYDLILTRATMTVLISRWRASRYPDNREYILRSETRARRLLERMDNVVSKTVTPLLRQACDLH